MSKPKTLTKDGYRERIAYLMCRADQWLWDAGYDIATDDQCACTMDPNRALEAVGMAEHWRARCGLPDHLADKLVSLLRGYGEDFGADPGSLGPGASPVIR